VIAIITHENAPRLHRVSMDHNPGKPGQTYLPLQDDHVHYAGQYLGLVIAKTFTQARDAAMTVKVDYDERKPDIDIKDALGNAFEPGKMGRGDKPAHDRGKPDETFSSAAVKVDQTYTTPEENHNPMELSATTARWDGDKLTLYNATQFVYGSRSVVATWLGIPDENVHVIDPYVHRGENGQTARQADVVTSADVWRRWLSFPDDSARRAGGGSRWKARGDHSRMYIPDISMEG
jgi:xanthine dehydrogenase YagR molybdenum-binding subunit